MPVAPTPSDPAAFCAEVEVLARRWASPDGARAILSARTTTGEDVALLGPIGHLQEGDYARVEGEWKVDDRFGPQVQVRVATPVDPSDAKAQAKFLTSLPGVGPRSAARLLDDFGDRLFTALDRDPQYVFSTLPRMSATGAAAAAAAWRDRRGERDLYLLLAPHKLTRMVKPLLARHGAVACQEVRRDPYALVAERGVGFLTADRIARDCGIPEDAPARAEAALLHALMVGEADGHTCLPLPELMRRAAELVGPVDTARLGALERRHAVVIERDVVWRRATHRSERLVASGIARLLAEPPSRRVAVPAEPQGGLTVEQWSAVRSAFEQGVSVVTGGPGTGKTTLTRAVVEIAHRAGFNVALCAPTGRAARRLQQATGRDASTVHRLLEWGRGGDAGRFDGPARGADDPLDVDLVVLDEASMAGQALMAFLLDAIPSGARLVIVGDVDQLPSVDAGRVLADLIASDVVPVTRLTEPLRQAKRSLIVRAAHAINAGVYPPTCAPDGEEVDRDFFVIARRSPAEVLQEVGALVTERLPRYYDVDPLRDILVLAPSRTWVASLNEHLVGLINPNGEPVGKTDVRVGDKALWTANDSELDLMNGMTVIVEHFDGQAGQAAVTDEDGRVVMVPRDKLINLQPAYAMTTHRAQGVEAPITITVMHRHATHPELLCRPLLYTAVTRARRASLIVGDVQTLADAIGRVSSNARHTGLAARLRATAA